MPARAAPPARPSYCETWATGPVCRRFLQNCECFRCTTYDNDEEAPDTKGVTDMDDLGMRNWAKDGKERKRPRKGPPSPIAFDGPMRKFDKFEDPKPDPDGGALGA